VTSSFQTLSMIIYLNLILYEKFNNAEKAVFYYPQKRIVVNF
jgi:hypothetical protein